MTTSFALLVHGDPLHACQANCVGVLMALFGLMLIPWTLASALCRRMLFVDSLVNTISLIVLVVLGLMLVRWAVVLLLGWRL
jgi:hypothetical protein